MSGVYGIVACIVALIKRHYRFAAVMGIWTVAALIGTYGFNIPYLGAPGVIFMIFALSLKKEPKYMKELLAQGPAKNYKCTNCGKYSPYIAQKCPNCGAEGKMVATIDADLPAQKQDTGNKEQIVCPSCGAKLAPEMKFCNQCGKKLAQTYLALSEKNELDYIPRHAATDNGVGRNSVKEPPTLNLSALPAKLRRAFIFIEDEEWKRAEEYLEPILDEEPENPYANLAKAMIKVKVGSPFVLTNEEIESIRGIRAYNRAKKYATGDLKRLFEYWDR